MAGDRETYRSPLVTRYAGKAMLRNFSEAEKVRRWRLLWIALAEAQRELGLPVREDQIAEMRERADRIDFERAAAIERETRHDVVAHLRAFAELCPRAGPILHLGATSAFVTDNADLLALREGLGLLRGRILRALVPLSEFARRWKDLPVLGFTHFQPAQATTLGKRACLWIQDLLLDLEPIDAAARALRFLGVKGTTGTQASFLRLFGGDEGKVVELDRRVAAKMGFEATFPVTGQTYPRKVDFQVLAAVAGVAISSSKFATDVRLLMHRGEVEEPIGEAQVGSSAMPYKRNPVRSERVVSLARFVLSLLSSAAHTAANQWLERTLDDSANRRLVLPEAFLASDATLLLVADVAAGLSVHPEAIAASLERELPFQILEDLLVDAVAAGGDRQALHEALRLHSREALEALRRGAPRNDVLERVGADAAFAAVRDRVPARIDASRYVGRAPAQTEAFLRECVEPLLARLSSPVDSEEVRV